MTGLLLALLLFSALAATASVLDGRHAVGAGFRDEHVRHAPDPGPRDIHTVSSSLGRAPVPTWG